MIDLQKWKEMLEWGREEKDSFFATHWQSPIEPQERPKFKGLENYPPEPSYLFELELCEHRDKKALEIQDTSGNIRNFLRWGEFRFKIAGQKCTLQAYKSDPHKEELFVPFMDATSGKETYGAGRYLDLDYERDRSSEGKWILDFNKAYNPWCAYSEHYACPFVPAENRLEVPVRAGEKNYSSNSKYPD